MTEKLINPNGNSHEGLPVSNTSSCLSDRSFFLLSDYEYGQLPYSPVDEVTGVPLLLHPAENPKDRHLYPDDKHHPWHPKNSPLVKTGTTAGEALRASRVQVASYYVHHLEYHRNYFGPELPTDDASRFKLIVLTAAGYIPERAVVFNSPRKPRTLKLTSEERINIWESNLIKVDCPDSVRNFLKEYSFNQDFSDVKESAIDEFLNTNNRVKKWELGNALLANSVYKATMPLRGVFEQAYKSELIPPVRTKRVTKFVMDALNIDHNRDRLINELGRRLLLAMA